MGEHKLPNKEVVSQITKMATECFKSFGGGQENKGSILGPATKDGPAIFALGVDISEVVTAVLTMAGYQKLLDACVDAVEEMNCGPNIDKTGLVYKRLQAAIPLSKLSQ